MAHSEKDLDLFVDIHHDFHHLHRCRYLYQFCAQCYRGVGSFHQQTELGLTLYIIAYGLGLMSFSTLGEIPSISRMHIYVATYFFFVILQIPSVFTSNYKTLMAMRFLLALLVVLC